MRRKLTMKKLLYVLSLLIIASMVLAACGGAATEAPAEPAEEPAAPAEEPTAEPAEEPAAPAEKVQIRWFVGLGTGTDASQVEKEQAVVDAFNASQDRIELVLEIVPYDSARDTLSTQIASGAGPDIIGPVGVGGSNAFYGQWLDLTPYIESSGFDLSVFNPALVEFYQTEEGQVGLPFLVFPAAVYYIPSMFDEAGLAYPPSAYGEKYTLDGAEVDWNWDTFTEVAKRLTVDTNGNNSLSADFDAANIAQVGYSPQWQTHVNYASSYRAGAAAIVQDGQSAIPDSWKSAMQWYYDGMYGDQPYMATGPLAGAPEFGNGNLFNSGKAAMAITPLWYTCCLGDFAAAGGEFQAGALPVGDDGVPHGRVDADTMRIWKGTQHPEEAFEVLTYLITDPGIEGLVLSGAYSGLTAIESFQPAYFDGLKTTYPFLSDESIAVFVAGLDYADTPSAEQYQPNWNEAWARQQTFFDLLQNTPPDQLDFEAEWAKMVEDLNVIYAK
jgi:multiple sugar transport system substrate-binding protein